jgi:hypothetical protein
VIVVIQLNPIFVFGCSPAPQSAKTLETGKDFPYLGHIHALAPTLNNLPEQSSIVLAADLSVFVNVFRKNEALLFEYLQFCRHYHAFYEDLRVR